MFYRLFDVKFIVLLYLCQGHTEGIVSWNMTDLCGAGISNDEYGGVIVFNTDLSPFHIPQCTVTITPKPLNGHTNSSKIQFYFTEFTNSHDCWQTNVTVRDGRSIYDPVVEGMSPYLCSTSSVTINQLFNTSSSSMTIVYSSNQHRGTSDVKFVIKFFTYHENPCTSEDEFECDNGWCVPSVYSNSTEIRTCSTHDTIESDSLSIAHILKIGMIAVGVLFFMCTIKPTCEKLKRQLAECSQTENNPNRCTKIYTCNREAVCPRCLIDVVRRLCFCVFGRLQEKCSGNTDTPNEDNVVFSNINVNTTTTASNRIPSHFSQPVDHDLLHDALSNVSEWLNVHNLDITPQGALPLTNILDDIPPNFTQTNDLMPPPDYGELFSPDYIYTPPTVQINNEILEVPRYEEAIRDSHTPDTVNESININAFDVPSETDNIPERTDQNVTVGEELENTELSPATERRLQIRCGFEHPFDFENDFDYYYSTDSDWETASDDTSGSDETLASLSNDDLIVTIQTENSQMESVDDNLMLTGNQETSNLGDSRSFTNAITNAPDSEVGVDIPDLHPEPPPPNEEECSPPYYYDYLANVNMYRP
ncbi:hypothetical protein ACF0H5_010385 [Mactra antiquata]